MRRYEKYKDSGVEWIGEIPEGWEIKKLKYVSYFQRGFDLSSSNFEAGTYPVYGSNGIIGTHNEYTTDAPSITIGRSGSVGEVNFIREKYWAHNTTLFLLNSFDNNIRFIYYLLISIDLKSESSGSAVGTLNRNLIHQISGSIPTSQEQITIANYLDRKTAEIDKLIAQKERLLELYEEEKTAIINQAVTRGIDSDVKLKDSGIDWLGEIPEEWEIKRLKYVVTINDEVLSDTTEEDYQINYVDISSVKSGQGIISRAEISFSSAPSRARRIARHGDIIVSTVRTYLKSIAKIENPEDNLIVSTGFAVIRPKYINYNFVGYMFYSEHLIGEIISKSVGVSYPAINPSEIANIFVPIPSDCEQISISEHIETETARIDAKIAKTKGIIALQKEYRTAMISEVVTGKIKVIKEAAS